MSFTLHINDNISQKKGEERFFSEDVVKLGRISENDLVLKDRFVSGRHAEIVKKEDGYFMMDLGSKNGVLINGEQLNSNEPFILRDNDKIEICSYSIVFLIQGDDKKIQETGAESTMMITLVDVPHEASCLSFKLRSVFAGQIYKDRKERIAALKEVIDKHRSKITDKADFKDILSAAMIILQDKGIEKDTQSWQNRKLERRYNSMFSEMGAQYSQGEKKPSTEQDVIRFGEKVKTVINLLIKQLSDSLHLNKEFQEQFDVESTRILNWDPNPIKKAYTADNIGKYLLNFNEDDLEDIEKYLNEVHGDILLHQLAILKGFKKCFHELLMEISPAVIAQEVSKESGKYTYQRLLEKIGPVNQKYMWERYVKKHQELSENETKTFNAIKNKFQQTYLSFLKDTRGKALEKK